MDSLKYSLLENKEAVKNMFMPSVDFYAKDITICGFKACICILEGLSSIEKLWIMALDALNGDSFKPKSAEELFEYIMRKTAIPVANDVLVSFDEVRNHLTSGAAVVFIDGINRAFVVSTQSMQYRSVSEPSGEGNLKGGKEGFIDLLRINISLIRRLVRTEHLCVETMYFGTDTKTETAIIYNSSLVPENLLKQVKESLDKVKLQMLFDTGNIAPFLEKDRLSLFSAAGYTERPDTAAAKICEGKIVIMVNGSPFALVVPSFFCENFQTMDDYSQRPYFATFIRLLKYSSFLIAILLPGVFVAISNFTPELFTRQLLYKIAAAEMATPLPLFLEAIFVNFMLEIVREAGLRMPKPIGHSVSLVAALIIGDAAIKAGIVGIPIVVVCAITSLASYVVPSLYEPIIILRVLFILAGGILGPLGIVVLGLAVIINICGIHTFGVPYTAPMTPYNSSFFKDGIIRASRDKLSEKSFNISDLPGSEW